MCIIITSPHFNYLFMIERFFFLKLLINNYFDRLSIISYRLWLKAWFIMTAQKDWISEELEAVLYDAEVEQAIDEVE